MVLRTAKGMLERRLKNTQTEKIAVNRGKGKASGESHKLGGNSVRIAMTIMHAVIDGPGPYAEGGNAKKAGQDVKSWPAF